MCAVPVPRLRGTFCGGDLSLAFFFQSEKGPSSRGLTHFVAAVLIISHICALKLGDITPVTSVLRGLLAGCRRVRGSSAAAPRNVSWECSKPGVFLTV